MPTLEHAFSLPLDALPSRSLFQGAAVARDPRDGQLYLTQAQAKATGPGDVEDLALHRYCLDGTSVGTLIGCRPAYVDTMIGKTFGHVQSLHTRISAAGNPWHWLGAETYTAAHKSNGNQVLRVRHRRGTITRTSPDVQRIHTGPGSAQVVPSEDWTIVLRRPGKTTETYEWHAEKALTGRLPGDSRPTPADIVTVPRGSTTYQSAAALGSFSDARAITRVNGATEDDSLATTWQKVWPGKRAAETMPEEANVTAAAPPGLKVTSEEPEAAFYFGGQLYVGKRYNSVGRRVVAYFRVEI